MKKETNFNFNFKEMKETSEMNEERYEWIDSCNVTFLDLSIMCYSYLLLQKFIYIKQYAISKS